MTDKFKLISPLVEQMLKFAPLGESKMANNTMRYGRAPHIGVSAYLHELYPPLSNDEIKMMGRCINKEIPNHLISFYKECNGFNFFCDKLAIYGLRIQSSFQPYDLVTPNVDERLIDADDDMIFIGGYSWDGSRIYTKTDDSKIYICSPRSAKPLKSWGSMGQFIMQEVGRISALFDSNGIIIDASKSTLPV
ncbi:SMI1/KNR4 family protein [Salmonella enterica]|nr:SMI1/KNR4 family protein [Salmonella enterica]